jgi:hypothetical protein
MGIRVTSSNNEFPFGLVVFADADIYRCSNNRSAFQAAYGCCIFVRRSVTCGYEGYCLSGKG